jgi:hypothetical protein
MISVKEFELFDEERPGTMTTVVVVRLFGFVVFRKRTTKFYPRDFTK